MNRRFRAGIVVSIMIIGLTGCKSDAPSGAVYQGKEDIISVSNNVAVADGRIMAGIAGYEKNGTKKALFTGNISDESFAVIDKDTGLEVLRDRIRYNGSRSEDGMHCGICDFTSLDKEGFFYIQTDSGICSEEFEIKEGLYRELLKERLPDLEHSCNEAGDIDKNCLEKFFLRIADAILAEEFFGNKTDEDNNSISRDKNDNYSKGRDKRGAEEKLENNKDLYEIPDSIRAVRAQTDAIKELVNDQGVLVTESEVSVGTYYQYSAVMSLVAYEYGQYDREYADECSFLAAATYKHAEEMYAELSDSDRAEADDKRFWAAAQLYKLTGKAAYREAAESYAEDPPDGFREDRSGYLGTIAYLTCYNRIDLNIGESLIMALMEDINRVIRKESVEAFLTSTEKEMDSEHIVEAFETARLMVLGNYITKNIKYVEAAESYLEYLYGMNMLGKDYAFDASANNYSEPQTFILAGLIDSYIYEDREPKTMER